MNIDVIDIMLDYVRLSAYAVVLLCVLKGIVHKKWSSLLFIGDLIMSVMLITTLIYGHLFNMAYGIGDEIFLTSGAIVWAVIHFVSMLKEGK